MNRNERSAQTPSATTGPLAWFRAAALATFVAALVLGASAAPAIAGVPPTISGFHSRELHSTRTGIFLEVELHQAPAAPYRVEYITKKSLEEGGSWALAAEGTLEAIHNALPQFEAQPLKPGTLYYFRAVAEDEFGMTEKTIEVTTAPIGPPEISQPFGTSFGICPNGFDPLGETFTFEDNFREICARRHVTSVDLEGRIQTNGADTTYQFEYALAASGPWTPVPGPGASGTVTAIEDTAAAEAHLTGLKPETEYFFRIVTTNEKGKGETRESPLRTNTAKADVGNVQATDPTGTSIHLSGGVNPALYETQWRFEYTTEPENPGSWLPGAAGTISAAEAHEDSLPVSADLGGLSPGTKYSVRLFAENSCAEGCGSATSAPVAFETAGAPIATTYAVHAVHGESLRALGSVAVHGAGLDEEQTVTISGAPTGGSFTLSFEGQTTAPIAFNAPGAGQSAESGSVEHALQSLATMGSRNVAVSGSKGGPYTVTFLGALGGANQPLLTADAAGLIPSSTVGVATLQEGGGFSAHYHFEYLSQQQFEAEGEEFKNAASTPETDLGGLPYEGGFPTRFVGADIPGLQAGETYRYRLVATNSTPGDPVVHGAEQSLTVPTAPPVSTEAACPNQALRAGPSANLPDCRGYEQLTPVDKEGSQEAFSYLPAVGEGAVVGADGDHLALAQTLINWGSGADAGQSPYFFSREMGSGWRMTAAAIQPETGVKVVTPELFAPNLSQLAFNSSFNTSPFSEGPVEFKAGPPGGPYAAVATVPRGKVGNSGGWVAASADFSKLVLDVEDHSLLEPTGTSAGYDLYEYSAGELRQLNVGTGSPGATIGKCGARMARGFETTAGNAHSSPNAVSGDGSRVFFEAVPSANCSEPSHLYMRVDGIETVDIGAYKFLAATADGNRVLLERQVGKSYEVLLYEAEAATLTPLFSTDTAFANLDPAVSGDLTAIYLESNEALTPEAPSGQHLNLELATETNLYRYDIPSRKLSFIAHTGFTANPGVRQISPNGRYFYWGAGAVWGVPGGAGSSVFEANQVYRYDSVENAIECISCASPSDPAPSMRASFGSTGVSQGRADPSNATPQLTLVSGDGNLAFFDTPAALVPADVDGEVAPHGKENGNLENISGDYSVSSDVYEWRKAGVDGCAHLQGCLALITNGRGGFLNLLLGSADEGRDVFIYSHSQLGPSDNDTAGDIYDARIGGGEQPAPPRPVECEGDACATPASAPNDSTPGTSTVHGGGGNEHPKAVGKKHHKPKKHKSSHKKHKRTGHNHGGSK